MLATSKVCILKLYPALMVTAPMLLMITGEDGDWPTLDVLCIINGRWLVAGSFNAFASASPLGHPGLGFICVSTLYTP